MRAVVLVALIACGSKDAEPPPPHATVVDTRATCASIVAHVLEVEMKGAAKETKAHRADFGAIIETRCTTDHWTQAMIDCLATARTHADNDKCKTLLTPDQQEHMIGDIMRLSD